MWNTQVARYRSSLSPSRAALAAKGLMAAARRARALPPARAIRVRDFTVKTESGFVFT